MKDLLVRVAVGPAGTLLLYRAQGLVGLAYSAAIWGPLMAKPIIEGFSESARRIRYSARNRVGWDLYGVGMYELRVQQVDGQPWIAAGDLIAALDTNASTFEYFDALDPFFTGGTGTFATMYRDRRHKLVVYHGHQLGELYDLTVDPWEFHNLWDDPASQQLKYELMHASFDAHVLLTTDVGSRRIAPM